MWKMCIIKKYDGTAKENIHNQKEAEKSLLMWILWIIIF